MKKAYATIMKPSKPILFGAEPIKKLEDKKISKNYDGWNYSVPTRKTRPTCNRISYWNQHQE